MLKTLKIDIFPRFKREVYKFIIIMTINVFTKVR